VRTRRGSARRHLNPAALAVGLIIATVGCAAEPDSGAGSIDVDGSTSSPSIGGSRFPDVVDATASYDEAAGTWSFSVTISSPYDSPERYADGWRVTTTDGTVLGTHTLLHDHAAEQPFTRTQTGVEIPDDVDTVTIEGRDQANGFGGATVTITLDRS
jgi:hypothetical protein